MDIKLDLSEQVKLNTPELIELRRDFHRHPELGNQEFRTSKKVADYLAQCGLKVSHVNETGIVGLLETERPGPCLMLRADMDALPVTEETGVEYCSETPGLMHACGHDAHTAMLLVAAKILSSNKELLKGSIKFVFQPNEENVGALAMIEQGVLELPKVDACMGLHVWAPIPMGKIAVDQGPVLAGMEHFKIVVKGCGGHTAMPHSAVDPIIAAASIVQTVQTIQTREMDALKEPTVIMFGTINGGTVSNVIPDEVTLTGTMRYLHKGDPNGKDNPKNRLKRIVEGVCLAHRTEYELIFEFGHPTLVNNPEMAALVRKTAAKEISPAPSIGSFIALIGEDFSEFAARVPSVFYFIGAGNDTKNANFPHHHPKFNIDEDALALGVEMHVKGAIKFFSDFGKLTFLNPI